MKILQKVLLLVVFSLAITSIANAKENVIVTDQALNLILDIQVEDVYAMPNRASYDPYYVLRDTANIEYFLNIPELEYVSIEKDIDGIMYDLVQFNDSFYPTKTKLLALYLQGLMVKWIMVLMVILEYLKALIYQQELY